MGDLVEGSAKEKALLKLLEDAKRCIIAANAIMDIPPYKGDDERNTAETMWRTAEQATLTVLCVLMGHPIPTNMYYCDFSELCTWLGDKGLEEV